MPSLRLENFAGLQPRTSPRLLGDMQAQTAENVDLLSGAIRAVKYPALVHTPSNSGPWLTVYRAADDTTEKWRAWTVDVDCAKVPLPTDVEGRYYWTGDGEPRFSPYTTFNITDMVVGVPTPTTAVSVSHSGGTGSAVTRFYRYTFVSALGEESGPSPVSAEVTGKVDGTWSIGATTAMQAFPANSGTGTAVFASGSTTFTNGASALHWLRVGDQVVISGATLTVTAVPTTASFKVAGDYSAATAWARKANWNTAGMYRRLYRTSGSSGDYQLVADNISATSYSDTLTDALIEGDSLISEGWEPPPATLRGIGFLPSGAAYGFVNNIICFSEPYQPHAWPISFQLSTDYPIVGMSSFGTVAVAATLGAPYMADGTEPATATLTKVDQVWPCLSKRGVVSVGDAVLYPTSHGMAMVGQQGASIWTQSQYAPNDWADLNPASMLAASAYGKVLVSFLPTDATARTTLLFAPGETAPLTTLTTDHDEIYADPRNGRLYFVDSDGVKQYDAGIGARMAYAWKSKEIMFPSPVNLGVIKLDLVSEISEADYAAALAAYNAEVAANAANVTGYKGVGSVNGGAVNALLVNGSNVKNVGLPDLSFANITLFSKGVAVFSRTVFTGQIMRLPAGFKTDNVSVQVSGTVKIFSIKLAETAAALREV